MKKILLLLFIGLFLISCKIKNIKKGDASKDSIAVKNNQPKDANKPMNTDIVFLEKVYLHPKFDQLKISSSISIENSGSFIPTINATTYIEQDKKVWMNLQVLFFNVARGIATPEGIKAYYRTDKQYIDTDFDYLNNLLNTNFINYKSFEKLLLGRTFIKINGNDFLLNKNAQGYKMNSIVNQKITSEDGKIREYKVALYYAENYDLMKVELLDAKSPDELSISYENWENFQHYRLPKNVKIVIKGSKNSQIVMENTKFDDAVMQTPFSIPDSYKKIEIQ